MIPKKTIVFFSNFLGFSGSEVLLKELLNALTEVKGVKVVLVGFTDGELLSHIDCRVHYISFTEFYKKHNSFTKRQIRKLRNNTGSFEDRFLQKINRSFPNALWVLNTIWLCRLLKFIEKNNIHSMVWVHEMPAAFEILTDENIRSLTAVPDKLICVSETVGAAIKSLNPRGRVVTIYPGILEKEVIINRKRKEASDIVTLGMSGRVDSNKNPLVFLELARYIKNRDERKFKLVWIGGSENNGLFKYVSAVVKNEQLNDILEFTGHLERTYTEALGTLDIFFLTSNYDSFPLVMLEASSFGIPIIGWNSGGISEFVNLDSVGRILRNRSVENVYSLITRYYHNRNLFDREAIQKRSCCFSRDIFINLMKNELILTS